MTFLIVLLGLAILYGMAAERFELFPYEIVHNAPLVGQSAPTSGTLINATDEPPPSAVFSAEDWHDKFEKVIEIRTTADVDQTRRLLIQALWGKRELPEYLPHVEMNIVDAHYADIQTLSRIDKLTIAMDFDLNSIAYQFFPKRFNGHTIIYHEGHGGDFLRGKPYIVRLLEDGYSVVAFSMPLLGLNSRPTVDIDGIGRIRLLQHDHMKFLAPTQGHPLKYFIEPVIVTINYIRSKVGDAAVAMIGLSGGGWTTTLAAAVDPRIELSFPVAGSYPIMLRAQGTGDWGDYEQTAPDIYRKVNYGELYVLGSAGRNRKQLMILNEFDPCCFAGSRWRAFYPVVRQRVATLGGGEFELLADDTHKAHAISAAAMRRILDELSSKAASDKR